MRSIRGKCEKGGVALIVNGSNGFCLSVCSRKSIDARMDDNSGSSGSPGGGHFAAPADKAAQRRADMRREEQERRRRVAVSG